MTRKFYHAACVFGGLSKTPQVDQSLNLANVSGFVDDWLRYSPTCWIIWSSASADRIYSSVFQKILTHEDHVLVVEAKLDNRYGFMSPFVWDWIDTKLKGNPISAQDILNMYNNQLLGPPSK